VVRARLAALAAGDWARAYATDPTGVEPPASTEAGAPVDRDDAEAPRGLADALLDPDTVLAARPALRTVVIAVALTAVVTWIVAHVTGGGSPQPIELAPGTSLASASGVLLPSGSPTSASPAGSTTPSASGSGAVVQVIGEVRRPGLVRLPSGARVADAVAAAGGLRPGGGTGGLNLARLVVDGEQIVVASDVPIVAGGNGDPGAGATPGDVVDLNTATLSDLDALPGVGPVMAGRILDYRAAHGRFTSIDQLREISGIGARTFERLKPRVRA
jgi:competence protein ComEA